MQSNLLKLRRKAEALFQKNRLLEAKVLFRKLCKAMPNDPEVWLNYGAVAGLLGELREAEAAFRRVVEINPHQPQAYFNLGRLLVSLGRLHEAEAYWRTYVGIAPAEFDGQYQLACVLKSLGRYSESVPFYREALRLRPDDAAALLEYGEALQFLGRFDEAEAIYRKVLTLSPTNGDACLKLAKLFGMTNRMAQSAEMLERVIAINPDMRWAALHQSATNALWRGDLAQAMADYNAAVALRPNDVDVRCDRSFHLLRMGQYADGWEEYEARTRHWKWVDIMHAYQFAQPRWNGSSLEGRTILIYAEQGFGDNIQFSRYLPLLTQRGAKVIYYCDQELLHLFRRMPGVAKVEPRSAKIAEERFDVHAPIMSLPHLFATRLDTIPAHIPYLVADPDAVAAWRRRMAGGRLNVGLAWSGRPTHRDNYWRSLAIRDLAPLAGVPAVKFHSLQKGVPAADFKEVAALLDIEDTAAELNDFDATAALIDSLDLVISVDTSVAHLAGALGRPAWTMLHWPADWRWLTAREDSPWYPTMRLFRRAPEEAWPAVIARVAAALQAAQREGFC